MTSLGYGDYQTWGGCHYDTTTKDDIIIEKMEDDLGQVLKDGGFGFLWRELMLNHTETVDQLLRGQLQHNRES